MYASCVFFLVDSVQDCEKAQCLKIKCQVGRLERGQSAILFIHSRLAVSTFLQVSSCHIYTVTPAGMQLIVSCQSLLCYMRLHSGNITKGVCVCSQADVQNHSYVVKSSAAFSVIEMPYKNLDFELPVNSTSVRV